MCYFIALASVYGKSVNLFKAQLKLVCMVRYFTTTVGEALLCCCYELICVSGAHSANRGLACSFSNEVFGLCSTGGPGQAVPG